MRTKRLLLRWHKCDDPLPMSDHFAWQSNLASTLPILDNVFPAFPFLHQAQEVRG